MVMESGIAKSLNSVEEYAMLLLKELDGQMLISW